MDENSSTHRDSLLDVGLSISLNLEGAPDIFAMDVSSGGQHVMHGSRSWTYKEAKEFVQRLENFLESANLWEAAEKIRHVVAQLAALQTEHRGLVLENS